MIDIASSLNQNSKVLFSHEVLKIDNQDGLKFIKTNKVLVKSKFLIVCGGLQADRLAKSDGIPLKEKVVGFRGDYYELEDHAKYKVKNPLSSS